MFGNGNVTNHPCRPFFGGWVKYLSHQIPGKQLEAFGAGASQCGDMQCMHRCLREGPRMAEGLRAAAVHELSGGEMTTCRHAFIFFE